MNELWKASEPGLTGQPSAAWAQQRVSSLVHAWWATYLAANLVEAGAANLPQLFPGFRSSGGA